MFKEALMGIGSVVSTIKNKIDSNENLSINFDPHLIKNSTDVISRTGIFDGVNGISDSSDEHYTFKKCMAALSLDIPVHEKLEMLAWSSEFIGKLSDDDYNMLSTWCKDAYKPLCKNLRAGINVESNAIEIATIFRWGNTLIRKDINLARRLLEEHYPFHNVMSDPSKFSRNVVYAHVNVLSYYYWDMSCDYVEREYYARFSISALNYLLRFEKIFKNRADYYLSMVYNVLGEFDKSLHHFIKALSSEYTVPFQKNLVIRLLFNSLPCWQLPSNLEKSLVSDNRILNDFFWLHLSDSIKNIKIKEKIRAYAVALSTERVSKNAYELSNSEINDLNSYIEFTSIFNPCNDNFDLKKHLYFASSKDTPILARHILFRHISYEIIYKDKFAAMYYASMSLYHKYSVDVATFIQRMLLDADGRAVCEALSFYRYGNLDLAIINTTESVRNAVWVDGDPSREIVILEHIINNSCVKEAIELAKIRAAFLYVKGECTLGMGLGIQNFITADEHLNSLSIDSIDSIDDIKSGIRDHGFYRHQRSLIRKSDNGEFIFIENKASDRLVIIFSCRYTYNAFQATPMFINGLESNALFINNPKGNWYSDSEEDRVSKLITLHALSRFKRENILCHNASMGGYAAMKFAIKHRLLCIASNPQFNLNFWSFARAADAERILSSKNIVNLDKMPTDEINGLNACIILGRHPHDVLPFQSWLDHAIKAKDFTYVIIKHDIPDHVSLMYRAYGDSFMRELYKEFDFLQKASSFVGAITSCGFSDVISLQKEINNASSGRWIIQNRNGQYFTSATV